MSRRRPRGWSPQRRGSATKKNLLQGRFGTVTPVAWVLNISVSAMPGWEQNLTLRLTRSDNVPPYHQGIGAMALHLSTRCFGDAGPQRL